MTIDVKDLRAALGTFLTGVTVVTTSHPDGPRGFTANSFTSVSLDPPLVLVCISRFAHSFDVFAEAESYTVNILSEAQKDVSSIFASKTPDKFGQVRWAAGLNGAPAITGATAIIECDRHDMIDAGDHAILIGRVTSWRHSPDNPLGYFKGGYVSLGLSQDTVAASGAPLNVGAILERSGSVALLRQADGRFVLPTGTSLGPNADPSNLHAVLSRYGLKATLNVLFSVFEDIGRGARRVSIYYRGTVDPGSDLGGVTFVPLDRIAETAMASDDEAGLLDRYVRERREDQFTIFSGRRNDGTLNRVMA